MTQVGPVTVTPRDDRPLVAGEHATWTYRIRLVGADVEPGGCVKIGYDLRPGLGYHDFPQHDEPAAGNWFSFSAPKGVELSASGYAAHHYRPGGGAERIESETYFWRDAAKGLISLNLHIARLEVTAGRLTESDVIEVVFGDTDGGGPGMITPSQATDMWMHWVVVQRTAETRPQLLGADFLPVRPGPAAAILSIIPSVTTPGASVKPATTVLDAHGNLVGNLKPRVSCRDRRYNACEQVVISKEGPHRIEVEVSPVGGKKISGRTNPTYCSGDQELNLYWGDIHGHCVFSDGGARGPGEYYQWAKDAVRLDFAALTDHDFGIALYDAEKNWSAILAAARRFNEDGCFVTLPGWEVSHLGLGDERLYGHKNVYFIDDAPPFYNSSPYGRNRTKVDYVKIEELVEKLKATKLKFLIVDHTSHCVTDWSRADAYYDRLVEVHSFFGTSEWVDVPTPVLPDMPPAKTSRAGLNAGLRLGFIAGSDTHMAAPGNFEETSFGVSGDAPGLAGVWASELSREAIFEALWNRKTYAVSGSRIFLDFKVNGHMMGDEFALGSAGQRRDVRIVIAGTSAIKRVELIHNNIIVKKWPGNKKWDMELDFQHAGRLEGLTADLRTNYYYVRVLQDNGHMAWSSPVWVNVSG